MCVYVVVAVIRVVVKVDMCVCVCAHASAGDLTTLVIESTDFNGRALSFSPLLGPLSLSVNVHPPETSLLLFFFIISFEAPTTVL